MATVVNNPGSSSDNSGVAMMLGAVALIIALLLILYYAVPAFTGAGRSGGNGSGTMESGNTPNTIINQENTAPAGGESGDQMNLDLPDKTNVNVPEVDVPENIDVNVNEGQQ